jgi:glutamate--cysteine ligase
MREYLPKGGSGALDMMRRTATVQPNFDFSDERDALDKLVLSLKIAPWLNAWLANSPFLEGQVSGKLSQRGDVWLRMPADRSGLVEKLWQSREPSYEDYIEWVLDAGMFLFKRDGYIIDNSGQPFREFLEDGYQGHHATLADWQFHLNTVFPEARLKSTLELRCLDALPDDLTTSASALMTGLLYDADALKAAAKLLAPFGYGAIRALRPALVARGLDVKENGLDGFALAGELLELASTGLSRRAARYGLESELTLLDPLGELVRERTSPAKRLIREFKKSAGMQPLLQAITL